MKFLVAAFQDFSWFFIALLLFAVSLPLSESLVSVSGGVLLAAALFESKFRISKETRKLKMLLLFLVAIFLLYLLSSLFSADRQTALYDLRKNAFLLVLPLAFLFGKEIQPNQKLFLFWSFTGSVFIATVIALFAWMLHPAAGNFGIQKASLISHIRFGFQIILAGWFLIWFYIENRKLLSTTQHILVISMSAWLFLFLFLQKSLLGMVGLFATAVIFLFLIIKRLRQPFRRIFLFSGITVLLLPPVYLGWAVWRFYDIEQVDFASLEKTTAAGNPYTHDLSNPLVENGRYVYRYVCEEELRSGWNQIASIAYDSAGASGYAVKETLLRYLTSKGLRKDASGVKALNQEDVRNIEQGVANYIYKKNAFSLYPRIYSTIWEYYVYTNTGYSDKQSFSQRIEFARAALTIIRQHPFFGVGAGDWKKAFHEAYDQNASTLNKELRGTAHNQYLNYLVKFGILGLLSIVFCFAYPVLKSRRYTDPLFVLFLVLMMAVNLGDSNLESHMGLSFFLFFYCLFLAADGTAYLRLKVRPRT